MNLLENSNSDASELTDLPSDASSNQLMAYRQFEPPHFLLNFHQPDLELLLQDPRILRLCEPGRQGRALRVDLARIHPMHSIYHISDLLASLLLRTRPRFLLFFDSFPYTAFGSDDDGAPALSDIFRFISPVHMESVQYLGFFHHYLRDADLKFLLQMSIDGSHFPLDRDLHVCLYWSLKSAFDFYHAEENFGACRFGYSADDGDCWSPNPEDMYPDKNSDVHYD
jgi:hypothetical protein